MNWFNLYSKIYDPFMKLFGFYKPNLILKYLKPNKKELILDLAGGTGFIANKISAKAKKVVVLDESKKMLNIAKKYRNLELCNAKAQEIPYKNSFFNSVVCIDALHHIKDIDQTLDEIQRVLKKNGKVLIYEFHIKGLLGILFWLFEKIYIDNSKFIKPDELRKKMKLKNFEGKIIKVSSIEYLYIGTKK